ncbi:MAG: 2-amino-4-ketopentanoate thiolase [Firmicutes bacterium]|nr:2-amino-4-ketopentanoate thiolase [Bacillota bacterium]MTI70774.1 2-amino-4-ketopentanoate thiolase [Bacillota bacterium]
MSKKGDWVKVYNVVLKEGKRAPQVPDDTKKVPLEMWVKGFLLNESAKIGDIVEIETYIGRKVKGELVEIQPNYTHSYGKYVNELAYIGRQLRGILEGGEINE